MIVAALVVVVVAAAAAAAVAAAAVVAVAGEDSGERIRESRDKKLELDTNLKNGRDIRATT